MLYINGKKVPEQVGTNIKQYYGSGNSGFIWYNGTQFELGSKASTNIRLLPGTGGITIIGDAGSTSHTLNTNDDLFVSGKLEVDGSFYTDASAYLTNVIYFGTSSNYYGGVYQSVDDGTILFVGATDNVGNRNLIISQAAWTGISHGHNTLSANPTLFIHSSSNPSVGDGATQWGSQYHDATDYYLTTGKGRIILLPVAGSPVQIGDAGTTSRGLAANDDLFVSGKLEVDGSTYLDGAFYSYGAIVCSDSTVIYLGGGGAADRDSTIQYKADDGLHIAVGKEDGYTNHNLILCNQLHSGYDFDHEIASTNPTFILQSVEDPNKDNQQFVSLECDASNLAVKTACGAMSVYQTAQKATAYYTLSGLPSAGETFTIGAETWTFRAARAVAYEVTIGADAAGTVDNMVTAINTDSAVVDAYDEGTTTCTIRYASTGFAGNGTVVTESATNMTVNRATLQGGQSAGGAWRREFHYGPEAVTAAGSGATESAQDATSYYLLDAITEYIYFSGEVRTDWDGDSDLVVEVAVANNAAETNNDIIRASLRADYYGEHEDMDTPKTQTVTVDHDITTNSGAGLVHRLYFRLDWDLLNNVIEARDLIKFKFWLDDITTAPVVDQVRFLYANFWYRTKYAALPMTREIEVTG